DYYQATFDPKQVTLAGLGTVEAENFGSGKTMQTLTVPVGANIDLDLQWDQPFPTTAGTGGSQNDLTLYLYHRGTILAQSETAGGGEPNQVLQYDNTTASTNFQLA